MTTTPIRNVTYSDPSLVTALRTTEPPIAPTVSGYGGKIPTRFMLRYDNMWRRVYMMQYGNSGTPYILHRGADLVLDTVTTYQVEALAQGQAPTQDDINRILSYCTHIREGSEVRPLEGVTP